MQYMWLTPGSKLKVVKQDLVSTLESFGVERGEALTEVELFIEHVTGMNPSRQLVCLDLPITEENMCLLERFLRERKRRVPIQYILGKAMFMGLELKVTPGVFIPRCDTETLVEVFVSKVMASNASKGLRILEIGPGSGAISIAILSRLANSQVVAADISRAAVAITKENALRHGVINRLEVVHTESWWELEGEFDAIVSNPPYIPSSKAAELQPEVALHEPSTALFGGDEDGLEFYRHLVDRAPSKVRGG
ncbi:MAG: peptide chain release factor N(5)-glutamine methyltransferase, partial [Cyanobacteria bacterium]|nr:peptide chain release factor N(5)-glutamine methyltransferase [Cyanobacteriota bacterium]